MGDPGREAGTGPLVQIVWSRRALSDLLSIRAYIGRLNPLAARRMTARLQAAASGLDEHSERGRPAGSGMRELTVVPPYVIRYQVTEGTVLILRIKHGAQAV